MVKGYRKILCDVLLSVKFPFVLVFDSNSFSVGFCLHHDQPISAC